LFSRDAKDEVAGAREQRTCCRTTFLQALELFGAGRHRQGAANLRFSTHSASVARAILAAVHAGGHPAHAQLVRKGAGAGRWVVEAGTRARKHGISGRLAPARRCCRRALLRAAFLTCGSVSDPSRGYHLEFSCRSDDAARMVADAIARLGSDAGITRRRRRPIVYVKSAQSVALLLANLAATRAVLGLEEHRALRQTKNSIRRTVNSEAANAARAATSAARQREAARRLLASPRRAGFTQTVREAARLRLAHPTRTLAELARAAHPPITKAAMASRMRLLLRLAER
jgi:DNA-binding protein WhiA